MAPRSRTNAVDIVGLADFQRDLRALGGDWPRALKAGNLDVAEFVREGSIRELRDGDNVQAHVAGLNAIRARAEQRRAKIVVSAVAKANAMSIGAVTGSHVFAQFDEYDLAGWVGGLPVGGYGPFEAIRQDIDEIVDTYGQMVDELTRRAFPRGSRARR